MINAQGLIDKLREALEMKAGYIWGTVGIEWTKSRQKQKVDYMVSKYGTSWKTNSEAKNDNYYGAAMYGDRWIGHVVFDCSGLFVWAYKAYGEQIYHGSNTIWNKYCSSKGKLKNGKRTDGNGIKPGTAVFVYKAAKDNRSHIGLYVGNGDVIEASGTKVGVIVSKITDSKWAEWGELKAVDYSNSTAEKPKEPEADMGFPETSVWHPTIRWGSKGQDVIDCQTMLHKLGYGLGVQGIDGDYGRNTEKAVKDFQSDHKLTVDGVCGPMTWDALEKAIASLNTTPKDPTYTVCIHGLDKTQANAMKNNYPGCVVTEE